MKTSGFLGNARSMLRCIALILAVLGAGCGAAFSEAATQLKWEMLIPPTEPLANFPDELPFEQQEALRNVLYWKGHPSGELSEEFALQRDEAKKRVDADREKLAKQGVDLDALYERYVAWATEIERRGTLTEKKLDGAQVAIAGYLLPLDFNPDGTTEFLLVPYFGACIHEPPPPPNQVIYLKSTAPYAPAALFEGVMITGTMRVQSERKDLSFVDGSSEVASGYVLESESIEPYQGEGGGQ
ncbi:MULTISPECIES: DUF3299 domain-containing protein [unclassified Mesorhizobium]|nr:MULTISPECIES: DUF3299 domain-containing protein [unclassified Mesorhizobium]MBZ9704950.1 DUF3299 domain-containing protein [Mesorhizobium sp. CO1-1-3]MBZ9951040.1 DUF3299 domain-containing protein [Mesorhizobium sp. BR1-1-11]MBZ9985102.1 DUF3299 domain-containing protein [Mesorhizobium sp. BR-1-1-8]MCA0060218.1 DUF3299 domain-containing protein [Mesorhizobium sp. B261B1A]TPI46452.1 DUF3299 domain-containing protein [Mesorhizobium sp. B3-1-1]